MRRVYFHKGYNSEWIQGMESGMDHILKHSEEFSFLNWIGGL